MCLLCVFPTARLLPYTRHYEPFNFHFLRDINSNVFCCQTHFPLPLNEGNLQNVPTKPRMYPKLPYLPDECYVEIMFTLLPSVPFYPRPLLELQISDPNFFFNEPCTSFHIYFSLRNILSVSSLYVLKTTEPLFTQSCLLFSLLVHFPLSVFFFVCNVNMSEVLVNSKFFPL